MLHWQLGGARLSAVGVGRQQVVVVREAGLDRFDWWRQVAIAGDDNGDVEPIVIGVVEETYRDVDVGFLLLVLLPGVPATTAGHWLR